MTTPLIPVGSFTPRQQRLLLSARDFMAEQHHGQFRTYTHEQYATHPAAVYEFLYDRGIRDHITLLAALLHDVAEDCGAEEALLKLIATRYGYTVANTCRALTKCKTKAATVRRLIDSNSTTQTVKLADIWHNCRRLRLDDPKKAKSYIADKLKLINQFTKAPAHIHSEVKTLLTDELNLLHSNV